MKGPLISWDPTTVSTTREGWRAPNRKTVSQDSSSTTCHVLFRSPDPHPRTWGVEPYTSSIGGKVLTWAGTGVIVTFREVFVTSFFEGVDSSPFFTCTESFNPPRMGSESPTDLFGLEKCGPNYPKSTRDYPTSLVCSRVRHKIRFRIHRRNSGPFVLVGATICQTYSVTRKNAEFQK